MSEHINLCFVDMIHQCSFDHWDQQKHCQFGDKNSHLNVCTELRMGWICACQDAYPTAKTVRVKEEDLPKIYRGEGTWGASILPSQKSLNEKIMRDMSDFVEKSTPNDENAFYHLHQGNLYEFKGDRASRVDEISPRYFINFCKQQVLINLDDLGYGDAFREIRHGEHWSRLRDTVTFIAVSRLGDIYQQVHIQRHLTEELATKYSFDIARSFIDHYKRLYYNQSPVRLLTQGIT